MPVTSSRQLLPHEIWIHPSGDSEVNQAFPSVAFFQKKFAEKSEGNQ